MERLRQYIYLGQKLDAGAHRPDRPRSRPTDPERAKVLKEDMLFSVRQKVQDLTTQLAVSVQGYLALDVIRRNNLELIKGVDRATTTTVSALRTAVIVAQALADQKLVLDQITALNTTTSNLIESTSAMLRQQSGAINEQAASATVDLEKLQAAFDNIYATMDEIDAFKLKALDTMTQTVDALSAEVQKSPGLRRTSAHRRPAGRSQAGLRTHRNGTAPRSSFRASRRSSLILNVASHGRSQVRAGITSSAAASGGRRTLAERPQSSPAAHR